MNNYLTNFNTIAEYNDFLNSNDCPYVNVSYIGTTDEVKYFKDTDIYEDTYFNMPFTVEILSIGQDEPNCTLFINKQSSSYTKYKINNGEWVITDNNPDNPITLSNMVVGDKVQIINIPSRTNNDEPALHEIDIWRNESWDDRIGGDIKVYGNIMSIFSGDEYIFAPNFPDYAYTSDGNGFFTRWVDSTRIKDILVNAENLWLPYRNLPNRVFSDMFMYYNRLVKGPDILAPEIPQWGCQYMFYGCSSLTDMPVIAATKMDMDACFEMFRDCSNLVNTTPLHVNTLYGSHTLEGMFHTCSSLTTTPQWEGDVLITEGKNGSSDRNNYFAGMFENCSSLTTANINIKLIYNFMDGEGSGMFYNFMAFTNGDSGSLITAPVIEIERPDGSTAVNIFSNMYNGQESLTEITYLSDDGNFSFGDLPDNGGTFYYKDGVGYDPAQYVPSSWTCEIYSE